MRIPYHIGLSRIGALWLSLLFLSSCGPVYEFNESSLTRNERQKSSKSEKPPQKPQSKPGESSGQFIKLAIWNSYIDPAVLDAFQNEFDTEVQMTYYESNAQLHKMIHDGQHFDIIMPTDFMEKRLEDEQLLAPLDTANLSNLANLAPAYKKPPHDPSPLFCVPYFFETIGMGYHSDQVSEIPFHWSDLFEPKNQKLLRKITILNEPRGALGTALIFLGHSPSTRKPEEIQAAGKVLEKMKQYIWKYDTDNVTTDLAKGETALALAWSADAGAAMAQNSNIRFTVPDEGALLLVDNFAIPKTSTKKKMAENFINFLLRSDSAARNSNYSFSASTVATAKPFIHREVLNGPSYHIPEKTFRLEDVGEADAIYSKVWTEITGSSGPTDQR